jgi:hypothetical protein
MSFEYNTDQAAELTYDSMRCVFKNRDVKNEKMKEFKDLNDDEKKIWRAVSNTIASYVINTIELNNTKHSVKQTLDAIDKQE